MERRAWSANTALMVLVFCVMCMALGVLAHSIRHAWRQEKRAIEDNILAVAQAYQTQQIILTNATEVLLSTLATMPLAHRGGEELKEFMRRLDVTLPEYAGFGIFNARGETLSAVADGRDFPPLTPGRVREREYFWRACLSRSFSVGESVPMHTRKNRVFLPMSQPILGPHDQVLSVIMAPLDMSRFDRVFGDATTQVLGRYDVSVFLLDRHGRVMFQSATDVESSVGSEFLDPCYERALNRPEDTVISVNKSPEGNHICIVLKTRLKDGAAPYMYVVAQAAEPAWWSFFLQRYYRDLLALAAALLLTLLVARWVARKFFGNGLEQLVGVVRRTQGGDVDARNGAVSGCREIQILGNSMDNMLDELQRLSTTDGLTGLTNRRRFEELARSEIERALRYGHSVGFVIADVDHFKKVNDTYGHAAGDAVLRSIAHTFTSLTRISDRVGRYGGEEFVLLLPESTLAAVCSSAEKLRIACGEQMVEHDGHRISYTVSFGVCAWIPPRLSPETTVPAPQKVLERMLQRADAALYVAKREGRNRVTVCEEAT